MNIALLILLLPAPHAEARAINCRTLLEAVNAAAGRCGGPTVATNACIAKELNIDEQKLAMKVEQCKGDWAEER